MAIAYDNSVSQQTVSPCSTSFTVATGATIGVVGLLNGASGWSPSSVTWGGVAMTQVATLSGLVDGNYKMFLYTINNPTSGASVTVTCTSGTSSGGIFMVAASYTGSMGTSEASHTDTNVSTTITNTVTTLTNNAWTVGVACNSTDGGGALPSANSGCTRRILGDNILALFDSNAAITPAGSKSMVYNVTGNTSGGIIISIPVFSVTKDWRFTHHIRPRPFGPGLAR